MGKSILILYLIIISSGCFQKSGDPTGTHKKIVDEKAMENEKQMNEKPIVRITEDISKFQGQKVKIYGTYTEMNLSKRPGSKPVFGGRVNLILEDSSYVMMDCDNAGIRNQEEIEKWRDKNVVAIGLLKARCNAWGDGSQATIVGPCLVQIETILQQ